MADTKTVIERAYAAFNKRDVDGALALMSGDVNWPKASEGGKVVGKEEVRAYWTRQWAVFDPHVEPLEITDLGGDKLEVRVHQLVKNLQGDVLSDGEVRHVFTVKNGPDQEHGSQGRRRRLIFWSVRCVCETLRLKSEPLEGFRTRTKRHVPLCRQK